MSIRVTTTVWEHSRQTGSALLVMLAIADQANEDGICWPSIGSLARKARLSPRDTQYVIGRLVRCGELEVTINRGRGHTNHYTINLRALATQKVQVSSPIQEERVQRSAPIQENTQPDAPFDPEKVQDSAEKVQDSAEKVQDRPLKGARSAGKGATAIAPEPYLTGLTGPDEPNEPGRAGARDGDFLDDDTGEWSWTRTDVCAHCHKAKRLNGAGVCEACTRGTLTQEASSLSTRVDAAPVAVLPGPPKSPRCVQCGARQNEPPQSARTCKNPGWHTMPLVAEPEAELVEAASG
jgi:hypothetical protein